MPTESATIREDSLLLAIFAAPDADYGQAFATLDAAAWQSLADRAEDQRGETLLREAIRRSSGGFGRFPALRRRLDEAARERTLDALRQAEALRRIAALLQAEGLSPVALKGVRLAWRTYPAPMLRPMRDLDLLLPAADVERAQALLLARPEYVHAEWAGRYGVEYGHQLPEIVDRETGVVIELHHRLNARGWMHEDRLIEMMETSAESIEIAGRAIRVPSAHANLLHLVEHATLHHMFDNGPAVLADLHYIAAGGEIDWPLLTEQAEGMGLSRALALLSSLAARHGAQWPASAGLLDGAEITPPQLDAADAALLRDEEEREQVAFLRRLETRTNTAPGLLAGVRAALSPGAAALAEIAGTAPDSPLRWLAYPAWLLSRLRLYRATRHARASGESSRQVRLLAWLHGG